MSGRPTVCHVTSVHVPTDSRILYHECRSLATRYRTLLVARDGAGSRTLEGVEIVALPPLRSRMARVASTRDIVSRAAELKADLYHFHDPELLPSMTAFARRTGVPVVYDAHEDYAAAMTQKRWIPAFARNSAAHIADLAERRNVPRLSAVVVADQALEHRFAEMNPRVVRLDNYPPLAVFGKPVSRPAGRATLMYVGSVSAVRGFHDMLEVLAEVRRELPDARLIVYGRPTEEVSAVLPAILGGLPEGALEMRGPILYGDLPRALAEANVGLSLLQPHPKYDHNVSMKVFDYMAAGVPWVASDFAPLREATGGTGGALVTPGDSRAAAEAVLRFLGNPGSAQAAAEAGRSLVERTLNWETVEGRLFALYEELVGLPSA